MSVEATFDFLSDAGTDKGIAPADAREAPGMLETAAAGFRTTLDETAYVQQARRNAALRDVVRALTERNGKRARDYAPGWLEQANPFDFDGRRLYDEDAVWRDVARDPVLSRQLGKRDAWERNLLRRDGERTRDLDTQARGSGLAAFAGAVPASFADPVNMAASLATGGLGASRGIAAKAIHGALGNVAAEALATPGWVASKRALGEDVDAGDVAFNIGAAGVFGAGLPVAGKALGDLDAAGYRMAAPLREAIDARLSDRDLARALSRAVPDHAMTPDQAAALHVLTRQADIDESMPFQRTHEAFAAHGERIDAMLETLADMPEAVRAPAPSVVGEAAAGARAPAAGTPGLARGATGFDARFAAHLEAAGLTPAQARGVAAGIHAESASNPGAMNPTSGAMGLGQWLGSRKRELIRRYGANPTWREQLDFMVWELRGGDHGGASVLARGDEAAVLDAYIRDFMRPAAGAETTGDLRRGMAALGRGGEMPAAGGDAGRAASPGSGQLDGLGPLIDEPLVVRPDALDAVRPLVSAGGRPVPIGQFRPDEIGVDAELMQFKSGGDQFGVTERLHGIDQWDPIAAGTVTVWEGLDGRRLIADGHQRLGLAKRIMAGDPAQDVRLNAMVLREADGFTARDARVLTALKNIGEGTGSAADAAKVFRDVGLDPDVLRRLPPKSALVRDGKALARLSDDAFGAVINEVIPESHAAAIGHLAPDPASHMALVDLLAQAEPANRAQAEAMVRQALDAGFAREVQDDLFGARETFAAVMLHKARVLDRTLSELRKLKGAFGVAARNAEALDAAGNRIDVAASTAAADANARALALVNALALRKDNAIGEIFQAAAERLANGEPIARVVRDVVGQLRGIDLDAVLRGADDAAAVRGAGGPGDSVGGSGRGGEPDGEVPALYDETGALTPAGRDALEAEGQGGFSFDQPSAARFDDPHGEGVRETGESLWHDLRAQGAKLDMDDGKGARSAAEIDAELTAREAGIAAIRGCLK